MKKWEYLKTTFANPDELNQDYLNILGQGGWELISTILYTNYIIAWFKKELNK